MKLEFRGQPVRRCECNGSYWHGCMGEDQLDFTCIFCGVTVPLCEGGGRLDELAENHDENLGVCAPCSLKYEDDVDEGCPRETGTYTWVWADEV